MIVEKIEEDGLERTRNNLLLKFKGDNRRLRKKLWESKATVKNLMSYVDKLEAEKKRFKDEYNGLVNQTLKLADYCNTTISDLRLKLRNMTDRYNYAVELYNDLREDYLELLRNRDEAVERCSSS